MIWFDLSDTCVFYFDLNLELCAYYMVFYAPNVIIWLDLYLQLFKIYNKLIQIREKHTMIRFEGAIKAEH